MPEYQNELRGSYWFVSLDEIERKSRTDGIRLNLQVVLSLSFDSRAGRCTPIRIIANGSRPKDTLLRIADRTISVHGSLLMGSKPLKELMSKARRSRNTLAIPQGMRICDLSSTAADPSILQPFADLLYSPCSSRIAHLPTKQVRSLYALCVQLEMTFHSKLVLRALKQIRHLNSPREVAESYKVASHDATWMKCFWSKVCQWLVSQPHYWNEFLTNHRALIFQAILLNSTALKIFTSNRSTLFGLVGEAHAADIILADSSLMRSFALSLVKPPPTSTAAA